MRLRAHMQRIGREASIARLSLGWTQATVARRAAVSQASVSRLEAGGTGLTIRVVNAVLTALGLNFSLQVYPGDGVNLRDSGQLDQAEQIRSIAHHEWRISFEEPIGDGSRRAADILMQNGVGAVPIELEGNLLDLQAQLRSGRLKREALQHRLGRPVAFVLALRDTERNRAAVAAHLGILRAALPAASREVLDALRRGRAPSQDGLLWLRSRRKRA
jgi:transcriptional regulator with XRE-family HTH domain